MSNKIILALVFFFCISQAQPQNGVKVLNSSSEYLVVEYTPEFDFFQKNKDGFYQVKVKNSSLDNLKFGQPEIPSVSFVIGVPQFGSKIEILSANYTIEKGRIKKYLPWEEIGEEKQKDKFDDSLYNSFQNVKWVEKNSEGISRGLRIESYRIFPILFNSSKNEIKKLKSLKLKITFKQGGTAEKIKDSMLSGVLLNYSLAKNWGMRRTKRSKTLQNSVLASGVWFRTNVTEEGIYKIDYNKLISLGFDPAADDPRTIKIFNNGGKNVPEGVTSQRPEDLVENSIIFVGDSDGVLNSGDYLLFYGHGSDFFQHAPQRRKILRSHNWFSKKNYYWITWGGSEGKRISVRAASPSTDYFEQNTTMAFLYHEKDLFNVIKSGRMFLGESFSYSQRTQSFSNTLNNRVPGSEIKYNYAVANLSSPSVYFTISESGNTILSTNLLGYGSNSHVFGKYIKGNASFNGSLTDDKSNLKFTFEANSTDKNGALDYFEIQYKSYLKPKNDFLVFFSKDTTAQIKFNLSGFSSPDVTVLDVTDFSDFYSPEVLTDNNGGASFYQSFTANNVHKFAAFTTNGVKAAGAFESVANSNLRGNIPNTKSIVIANRSLKSSAEKLVNYLNNESPNSVPTSLFYTDDIFNEFSCGAFDPGAIRDFIRYLYLNSSVKPEYVLLFGNGSYDYFNTENKNNNLIPMRESNESLYEVNSYFTDDYYAMVDGNDAVVDLAVARLPVENNEVAEGYIDKLISYENNTDFSEWRSKITLLADDGLTSHGDDGNEHTYRSESLSSQLPIFFEQDKIYLIQYPTVVTGLGRRKPLVNKAIVEAINDGTLIFNFYGHGNPDVLTHERVFISDVTVPQLNNKNYFFLSAATCDFGRSDDPTKKSGAEKMLLKPDGGAIGSFASNRPVFSPNNAALNEDFYHFLVSERDSNNLPNRIGWAFFKAKVLNPSSNTEKFSLLSVPTLRLLEPRMLGKIDSVNGASVENNPAVIKALGDVSIAGEVLDSTSAFTGEAIITVHDARRRIEIPEWNYHIYEEGGILYKGRASVVDGKFVTRFVVPKDISYGSANGKVTAYFFNDNADAIGGTDMIKVSGVDTSRINDGQGPSIEIFYDNTSDENGYLVNPDFSFYAKLEDETGINTSGLGLGHKLEGIIDDDEENPIDFTNYFIGDLDRGGKSGEIKYNFYEYKPGDYTITVKAWDVFNNLSLKKSQFTVVSGDGLTVKNIVNFPNPFSGGTYFTFQHNLTQPINVRINVYTVYGRKIKEIQEYGITDKFVKIFWDGLDEDGDQLANGTYLYRINVNSENGDYSESFDGKLAVIK